MSRVIDTFNRRRGAQVLREATDLQGYVGIGPGVDVMAAQSVADAILIAARREDWPPAADGGPVLDGNAVADAVIPLILDARDMAASGVRQWHQVATVAGRNGLVRIHLSAHMVRDGQNDCVFLTLAPGQQ